MADPNIDDITDHLFRKESGRMVAVLTRVFGWGNSQLVEDVVQDAFVKALNVWRFGMPDNPSAWLMRTARNAAVDALRRRKFQEELPDEHSDVLSSEYTLEHTIDHFFLEHEIEDSVLRMMFACCDPRLSIADRIALTLRVCAGFSVEDVSKALLLTKETAKKRVQRAKKQILDRTDHASTFVDGIPSGADLSERLHPVLQVIYLIFTEGYGHSERDVATRKDLCLEALRLALLLTRNKHTAHTDSFALVALLALLAARFEARIDEEGELVSLNDQDRSKLDSDLVNVGLAYLARSTEGGALGVFQIEATIAYEHINSTSVDDTNWSRITDLYQALSLHKPSPVVTLNLAIARSRSASPEEGINTLMSIPNINDLLDKNHMFAAALADFKMRIGDLEEAIRFYDDAISLARYESEKKFMSSQKQRCMELMNQ